MKRRILATALVLVVGTAASRSNADIIWSWDGAADPGFVMSQPDSTSYYDAGNQVLRVGYGSRPDVAGLPQEFTTVFYKALPQPLSDCRYVIEYTVHQRGYFVDPMFSDDLSPVLPAHDTAALGTHIYAGPAGAITGLEAHDHGAQVLGDTFLSTGDPLEGARYRATAWRSGTQIGGSLERYDNNMWSLLGAQGPHDLPSLTESMNYLRFDQINYGDFGQLWVHAITVENVPEPATLTLAALGGIAVIRRRGPRG